MPLGLTYPDTSQNSCVSNRAKYLSINDRTFVLPTRDAPSNKYSYDASSTSPCSSIQCLQTGQLLFRSNQGSMQPGWKRWKHGRVLCSSSALKSSIHTAHALCSIGNLATFSTVSLRVGSDPIDSCSAPPAGSSPDVSSSSSSIIRRTASISPDVSSSSSSNTAGTGLRGGLSGGDAIPIGDGRVLAGPRAGPYACPKTSSRPAPPSRPLPRTFNKASGPLLGKPPPKRPRLAGLPSWPTPSRPRSS